MNCIGWKCRGLGNSRIVGVLHDLVKDRKPDVLFLSETISIANKIENLRVQLKFSQCFSVDRMGNSSGLAVFWKDHVRCQVTGFSRNHVDLEFVENSGTSWRLTGYYGYPERQNCKKSWDLIRHLAGISQIR